MSTGQNAANETKGAFKQVNVRCITLINGVLSSHVFATHNPQDTGESVRKNVNSFADSLLGTHKSTGYHPNARETGKDIEKGVDDAGKKLDQMIDKHKK